MSRSLLRTKTFAAGLAASLMLIIAGPAFAWDGAYAGTISMIDVANGDFRVYTSGGTAMCSNGTNWGYLIETDTNYKTFVAALMMAKAQGSTVYIYTTLVNGYCHIAYIQIL